MNTRDDILARLRRHPPAPLPLPELPAFVRTAAPAAGPLEAFAAALDRMGGRMVDAPGDGDVGACLARLFPDAGVVCSAVPELPGNRSLASVERPRDLHDVDVGVVRARLGVAETGSVLLTEHELVVEAIGFLSQHLVVLLDPARIVATLHDAYRDPALTTARYAIFMTGPSATADIEGVLIHGAQGIRSLTVIPQAP